MMFLNFLTWYLERLTSHIQFKWRKSSDQMVCKFYVTFSARRAESKESNNRVSHDISICNIYLRC